MVINRRDAVNPACTCDGTLPNRDWIDSQGNRHFNEKCMCGGRIVSNDCGEKQ